MSLSLKQRLDASHEVRYIHSAEEFDALRDAWCNLLTKSAVNSIFLTWEWLSCWWQAYGKQKQLWLVTAWQDETLVGIAPMMLTRAKRYGMEVRILRSLGAPDIDIGGFIICDDDQDTLTVLCRALAKKGNDWDLLEFNQFVSENATSAAILNYFTENGFVLRQMVERHFYLPTLGDWDDYYRLLSKNLRDDLRKKVRRAEKMGPLLYKRYIGSDVTQAHLSNLFQVSERSRYPDVCRTAEEEGFQRSLLNLTSPHGWPDLSLLSLNSQPIAYIYGFNSDGRFEAWRTGFDLSYFEISVGKLILMYLLEDCFRRGYKEVDFLRGDEGYKEHWQPLHRVYYTRVRIITPRNLAAMFAFVWVPDIKSRLKSLMVRILRPSPLDTNTNKVRKAK